MAASLGPMVSASIRGRVPEVLAMQIPRLTALIAGVSLGLFALTTAGAAKAVEDARVALLLTQALPDLPDREIVLATVEYLPGGASAPHRHDAHVFVYVLAGAVRMQISGHAATTLTAGQVYYESPDDIHQLSANASATEPAKLLVIWLKDRQRPLSRAAITGGR